MCQFLKTQHVEGSNAEVPMLYLMLQLFVATTEHAFWWTVPIFKWQRQLKTYSNMFLRAKYLQSWSKKVGMVFCNYMYHLTLTFLQWNSQKYWPADITRSPPSRFNGCDWEWKALVCYKCLEFGKFIQHWVEGRGKLLIAGINTPLFVAIQM